jgi:hypothetical protein
MILDHPPEESFRRGLATLPGYFFFTWGTICAFMILKACVVWVCVCVCVCLTD